jgi:hypothetical protein
MTSIIHSSVEQEFCLIEVGIFPIATFVVPLREGIPLLFFGLETHKCEIQTYK